MAVVTAAADRRPASNEAAAPSPGNGKRPHSRIHLHLAEPPAHAGAERS